jgi:amino acid transporter/mannitol/fructose-specific phosphotransferase system IIA component (Ntr-type)
MIEMASEASPTGGSAATGADQRLEKELSLFDVYVIGLGPMLSSGFFLLPGLAAAMTGSSVVLAYFLASLVAVPAALSIAELSAAMPRAGGIYYFLDRSLGPMVGTIGGLGTWLVLVLKSAFALVGMGAYLVLFIHLPIRTVAIVLTLVFALVNMLGARHTGGLQRVLVSTVLGFLVLFLGQGFVGVLGRPPAAESGFEPFMSLGVEGLVATMGLVFISFAGPLKVASVAEEVRGPDRTIPAAIFLGLLTASLIYVAGVYVMVATIAPEIFHGDLTPFATAGIALFGWLPRPVALALVALPALAGLAASANAGLLAASRYPLAMARDKLVSPLFAKLGRFRTPTVSIFATAMLMVFSIAVLDVLTIAKLASAFLLLIFSLVNLAVIVMRESGLASYDPGFRAPLYPWVHVLGLLVPFLLIAEMGIMPIVFSIGLVAVCLVWYFHYARGRIKRAGALLHWFHRLARRPYEGAEVELRGLLQEEGQPTLDPFDEVIGRAFAVDLPSGATFADAARKAAELFAERLPVSAERLATGFLHGIKTGATPVLRRAALPHLRLAEIDSPAMVIMRSREGMQVAAGDQFTDRTHGEQIHALFFLVSPWPSPGNHLRTLAEIVARVAQEDFLDEWLAITDKRGFKEAILRTARFLSLGLHRSAASSVLIDRPLREINLPQGSLIALIHRGPAILVPQGDTILREGDRLSIVGDPEAIREIGTRYGSVREGQ